MRTAFVVVLLCIFGSEPCATTSYNVSLFYFCSTPGISHEMWDHMFCLFRVEISLKQQ